MIKYAGVVGERPEPPAEWRARAIALLVAELRRAEEAMLAAGEPPEVIRARLQDLAHRLRSLRAGRPPEDREDGGDENGDAVG